ncbi:hypothetical protein O0L34_g7725 [Tuta absoluta]|nr:hypothetical protein O0L34_g7725 [Tuta absoluta]
MILQLKPLVKLNYRFDRLLGIILLTHDTARQTFSKEHMTCDIGCEKQNDSKAEITRQTVVKLNYRFDRLLGIILLTHDTARQTFSKEHMTCDIGCEIQNDSTAETTRQTKLPLRPIARNHSTYT